MSSDQDQASQGGAGANGSLPAPATMPGPVPAGPVPAGPVPPGSPAAGSLGGRGQGGSRLQSAWKTTADGKTVFRLMPPLVLWWAWIAFGLFNVIDLAVQSHNLFAVKVTVAILAVTGLMYACALRPKIISDASGLTIRNPFRDYQVPWGGVAGVFVGDSVEIQCERPAPKPERTIYSWALYSPRRSRARAELRTGFGARRSRERHDLRAQKRIGTPGVNSFGKMPAQAKEMASQHPSHIMAGELARRCNEARDRAASTGVLTARWAWAPIAAVLIPLAGLIALIVAT